MRSRTLRRRKGDSGVALIEFASLVPLLGLALLLVWQVVLVGLTSMYASHGSAEGARQAAVTPYSTDKIDREARKRVAPPWNDDDAMSVEVVEDPADGSFVQVRIKTPAVLPGFDTPWEIGAETRIVPEGRY
ncbi:hypothetical protein NOGI109294_14645 [Nocardiopsis gilva]|uniref:hypothetical protein n=1 Tax=Nocardiopsis gilva TaxID=280236 RepID=UPI00036D645D|nr:hypothetical protein [Nocardiopsis gilva]